MRIGPVYILLILLFGSCTTKYSSPYSAKDVANDVGKMYSAEIEIVKIKKDPFFKGNKRNRYLLKDKKRGFLFEAGSYVAMDQHIPLHEKNRWDSYSLGLMRHYHDDVLQLADKHKIKLVPPPLLKKSEYFPEIYSWARDEDSVFIHSNEELSRVADLYIELAHLYNFTYEGRLPTGFPELVLNYALSQSPDSIIKICYLPYLFSKENPDYPGFNRRIKTIYTNYIPEKYVVYDNLYESWNKAIEKGLISQEKARYKQSESKVFGLIDYDEKMKGYNTVTDVSGKPVIVFFQPTGPELLPENILISELVITNSLYNNYIQKAFPILDKELEETLRNNGRIGCLVGEVNLMKENLTEQLPLYSIIVRRDGSMVMCYKISFVSDFRLLLIATNLDGKYMGGGVLCSESLALFHDLLMRDLDISGLESVYSIYNKSNNRTY